MIPEPPGLRTPNWTQRSKERQLWEAVVLSSITVIILSLSGDAYLSWLKGKLSSSKEEADESDDHSS